MNPTHLESTLRTLRLSGLAQSLSVRLQEAAANRLAHGEFLELILQDELNVRHQRLLSRRTQAADFHGLKPIDDFDWSFNPSIHKKGFFGDFRVICDWRERPEESGGVGRSRLAGSASAPPAHARRKPTSLASGVAFLSGFPRG